MKINWHNVFFFLLVAFFVVSILSWFFSFSIPNFQEIKEKLQQETIEIKETQLKYQGPVQEGYNETLFRETGNYETITKHKVLDSERTCVQAYDECINMYYPMEETYCSGDKPYERFCKTTCSDLRDRSLSYTSYICEGGELKCVC